jgi:hypothetical protein
MSSPESDRLKLRARGEADFAVVSSVLQDALLPVRDMASLPREKRFVVLANRFRWEARAAHADLPDQPRPDADPHGDPEGDASFEDAPLYERVQCGVTFDRVTAVRFKGFRRDDPDCVLNLLAVMADAEGVTLQCSGGAGIRLQGRRVVCHLEDLGEPWPTRWRPSHDAAASASEDRTQPPTRESGSTQSRSEDS